MNTDDAWTFRRGAGDGAGKTEHEILADLVASARHDADGTRIITLNIDNDCRQWELFQRGNDDVKVVISGSEPQLPKIQLDALAYEFDEDHIEGTGDIRWKGIMKAAAHRAAQEPGYNSRGIDRP